MNRAFGVTDYEGNGASLRPRRKRKARKHPGVGSGLAALVALAVSIVVGLLLPLTAAGNPDHFAGDYVIFAKALTPGVEVGDRETFEPSCDGSLSGQGEASGQGNKYYGRIHSNADLKLNGANTYKQTVSLDTEITYGVHEPATCQLQNDGGGIFEDGSPLNISGNGDPASVQGPYQIGPRGWPGNLGDFVNDDETFTNDSPSSAVGMTCQEGSLTSTEKIEIKSDNFEQYRNKVVCNGSAEIVISANNLGSPFKITMLSHHIIEIAGQGNTLVPADGGHGVLAWTDLHWDTKPAIKLAGSNLDVPQRSILFAPRNSIDVSGSVDADVCIQAIGQGIVKVAGSGSNFGPFGPGCGVPASVVTQIHAGTNHDTDIQGGTVPLGTEIHDKVTVSSNNGTNLTGSTTVNRYNNGTCSDSPAATQTFGPPPADFAAAPSVMLDPVLAFTPPIGTFSYRASYNGDGSNLAATGVCEGPVTVVAPDLTVVKANNVGGSTSLGESWTWTVTVTNGGGANATFADGQTIVSDPLPSTNIAYGAASAGSFVNVTNSANISCGIASNTLTCTASGAAVTIGANTGSFAVSFLATPSAVGSFVNAENVCVDPNNNVTESNENNNTCSDTVTVTAPDLTSVKDDDVGGTVVLGSSFTWTITVSNGSNGAAIFNAGEKIVQDTLPAGPTYGGPTVGSVANVTNSGSIGCGIVANVLTCTANGATVTIGANTGSFAVSFLVTPQAAGQLVNGENICVDPDLNVPESNELNNTCQDTVTVTAPDLTSTKADDVNSTVVLGDSFTWTITVSNASSGAAVFGPGEKIVGDTLPAGPTYAAPSVSGVVGVTNDGAIDCAIAANVLTCTADGATVTIAGTTGTFAVSFLVTPVATGDLVNASNICVDPDLNVPESNEDNNTCSDTVTVTAPDLDPNKENDTGGAALLGESWDWTVTLTNTGNGPANFANGEVVLTDTLPGPGITYSNLEGPINPSLVTGTITCGQAALVITCTATGPVSIAATGSFQVKITATATAAGSFQNNCTADPGNNVPETNEDNNTCQDTVTVTAPDLTSTKADDVNSTVVLGDSFTWTITVSNASSGAAVFGPGEKIVGDTLPAGPTYAAPSVSGVVGVTNDGAIDCAIAANVLTCTADGATVTIAGTTGTFAVSFLVTPVATGDLVNASNICVDPDLNVPESNEDNNTCSDTVTVTAPDLDPNKENDTGGAALLGESWDWTVTLTNTGNGPANFANGEVVLTDTLPGPGITYSNLEGPINPSLVTGTITCGQAALVITCTATGPVSIAATGSFQVKITATATAAGSFQNNCTADPGNNVPETNEDNNTCQDTVTVTAPDLTSTKADDVNSTVVLGDSFTWTITVSNASSGAAVFGPGEKIVGDTLPAGPTYAAPSVSGVVGVTNDGAIDCAIAANVLTCTADGATVTIAGTTGTFAVSFLVTPVATGDLVNASNICVDPDLNVPESNEDNNTCSDTVTVTAPDLDPNKENDTGGAALLGESWDWTVTLTNTGNGPANFANGEVVLTDTLPGPGITYSNLEGPINPSLVTGTITCGQAALVITCTATGPVSIAATGSFQVKITATATAAGSFQNNCTADPGNNVPESNEQNNTCSNTVTVAAPGGVLLIIDEDSLDNGIHFNDEGGLITPSGPDFFSKPDVNDDKPGITQRDVLRYFSGANVGRTITVRTGQTGDEGWFAPTCIPAKWLSGSSNNCLTDPALRQQAIDKYWGTGSGVPSQSRLDKIPAVMPLRALGLNALVGKNVCAVVYDSDISINYDKSTFPFTSGNLQGETLGIVAFTVNVTTTLDRFSSSTLPQVTLTIKDAATCNPTELFNAPVPRSSSVPNDRIAPGSATGYRQEKTFPTLGLFF